MKIEVQFLIAPDESAHRIAIMHTTEKELEAHQKQLEEIGIASIIYDSKDGDWDKMFITSIGDFFVVFEK